MVVEFQNAASGVRIRAARRMEHMERDLDIEGRNNELVLGRITVLNFLLQTSNYFLPIRLDLQDHIPVCLFHLQH